jgi:putative ABC transport system ATP-binding protein
VTGIDVEDVTKTYRRGKGEVQALRGASLHAQPGRLTVLKGRSGAGKTTLLNLLAGLDRADAGSITVAGTDVTAASDDTLVRLRRETVSMIYQHFALLPLLTAEENVGVPLRITRASRRERDARVAELVDQVGLTKHAAQRPAELSGGQLQRVAIARALVTDPEVLLADEPTAQLDSHTGTAIMELLHRLVTERGMTALVATHDPMIESLADAVLHLDDGVVLEHATVA